MYPLLPPVNDDFTFLLHYRIVKPLAKFNGKGYYIIPFLLQCFTANKGVEKFPTP